MGSWAAPSAFRVTDRVVEFANVWIVGKETELAQLIEGVDVDHLVQVPIETNLVAYFLLITYKMSPRFV